LAIDRISGLRSYSPIGYICNEKPKPNLHILTGAQATKILLKNTESGVQATGVTFNFQSKNYNVTSSREVILSAGSIQTPQLLELSGIGNSSILANAGIITLIDLPGVGENFQEQPFISVEWNVKDNVSTTDILRNNATLLENQLVELNTTGTGLLAQQDATMAFVPFQSLSNPENGTNLLEIFDNLNNTGAPLSLSALQHATQRSWLKTQEVASAEFIFFSRGLVDPQPGESYLTVLAGIMHPTSRGRTHINSSDPLAPPVIDPQLLSNEFDQQLMLEILRFVLNLEKHPVFSGLISERASPAPNVQSDDDLMNYIRETASIAFHMLGTAPMASRELGGVVDSSLKVYGTTNLRVVDCSVIPLQIAAHTQATVYAIAERAASIILGT
jgi:choline dehydrogenase-like flavoprotein